MVDVANELKTLNALMENANQSMEEHLKEFLSREIPSFNKNCTHEEFIEQWAQFVKTHPYSVWKKQVGPLIDAQIIIANRFYARLAKMPGGAEKIRKLREMKKNR